MRNVTLAIPALSLVVACSSSSVTNVVDDDSDVGGTSASAGSNAKGGHSGTSGAASAVGGVTLAGGASASGTSGGGAAGSAIANGGSAGGGAITGGGASSAGGVSGTAGTSSVGTATGGNGTAGAAAGGTAIGGKAATGGAATAGKAATGGAATGGAATGGAATGGAPPSPCASQPCLNGGTCTASGSSYTCQCAAGYSGTTCATNINDCLGVTCGGHGTCVDGVNTYNCQCAAGYSGTTCGTAVAPKITLQPQAATVCLGTAASFSVAATGAGTLSYQWKQLIAGSPTNVGTGAALSVSTVSGSTPPYTNTYYVVVTDSANGATAQSNNVTLTVNPIPSSVRINQWGTNDHVWVELSSLEPDGSCALAATYRYSNNAGSSWTAWANEGYCFWWPNVGPLGLASGAIVVQAYVTNGYGCNSAITQGAYVF